MNVRIDHIDRGVLLSSILMLAAGIVFVYSSSFAMAAQRYGDAEHFLIGHAIRAVLALGCFAIFLNIDYHKLGHYSHIWFVGAIILLVWVVVLPDHAAVNGAKRWVRIGPISFQASEFARIALIIVLANQAEKMGDRMREQKVFFSQLLKIASICGLILIEPNFSTAAMVAILGLGMLFVGGARISHLALVCSAFIPVAAFIALAMPYRLKRIMAFISGNDTGGVGYQTMQSLIGLGHGGVFGTGLGAGQQKFFFLPEAHTDFVFSILGEELGYVGLCVILSAFFFLIWRGMRIAVLAQDRLGRLLAFGLTLIVAMYVVLHAFVNVGIVPTTGVPLPFFSYGGMSLIFTMSSLGIILNVSMQTRNSGGRV